MWSGLSEGHAPWLSEWQEGEGRGVVREVREWL